MLDVEQLVKSNEAIVFKPAIDQPMDEIFALIEPLLRAHWCEVANYKDQRPIDLDRDFYRTMRQQGRYVGVLAHLGERVVGYSSFFLKMHPHYKTWKIATNDVYFITPECRNIFVASRLFEEAANYLKTLDVKLVVYGTKKNKDVGRLLRHLKCVHTEDIYEQVL